MSTREEEPRGLRELHEDYVWLVNAAIEEGREDIAWQLSDDYLVEAMELMTVEQTHTRGGDHGPTCTTSEPPLDQIAWPKQSVIAAWWTALINRFR